MKHDSSCKQEILLKHNSKWFFYITVFLFFSIPSQHSIFTSFETERRITQNICSNEYKEADIIKVILYHISWLYSSESFDQKSFVQQQTNPNIWDVLQVKIIILFIKVLTHWFTFCSWKAKRVRLCNTAIKKELYSEINYTFNMFDTIIKFFSAFNDDNDFIFISF